MSNVVYLFAKPSTVQLYTVQDPGVTWYEEGQVISEIQLKNDATQLQCSVEDILEEMLVQKLYQKQQLSALYSALFFVLSG